MQTIGEPDSLDPAVDYETYGGMIIENVYETLVWYKGESVNQLEGLLAESWSISHDELTYTFKLRRGVRFHDGSPFNATAVKYSLDRAILTNDPDGPAWIIAQAIRGGPRYLRASTWAVTNETEVRAYLDAGGIQVIDDYTVRISLERPYAPFIYCLAFQVAAIVSPTYVEAHGGVKPGFRNEWISSHASGTGPFRLVEWTPKQRVVLDRNMGYWRQPAQFRAVVVERVDEVATRELNLFVGDADVVFIPTTNAFDVIDREAWLSAKQVKPLRLGVAVLANLPTLTIMQLQMNLNQPPFNNRDFRYGVSYAFDYQTFIDGVVNGFGFQGIGPIPKGLLGYDETLFQFRYDPEKAKEYFAKAGWKGKFTVYYNAGNEIRKRGSLLLKDGIEALGVGINVEVQELDWPTFLARIRKAELPIFFVGWSPDYADPDNYVIPYGHSMLGTFAKRVGYKNASLDGLIEAAAKELNQSRRLALYRQIQRTIVEEAVYVWAFQATSFFVARDWVKGYYHNSMHSGPYFYAMWNEKP